MRRVCKDRSLPLWRMAMFSRRAVAKVAEKAAEGGARCLFVADGAGKMRKLQQNEGKEPVKRAEPRFRRNPTIRSSSTARRKQKIDGAPFGASSRRGRSIITAWASPQTTVFDAGCPTARSRFRSRAPLSDREFVAKLLLFPKWRGAHRCRRTLCRRRSSTQAALPTDLWAFCFGSALNCTLLFCRMTA